MRKQQLTTVFMTALIAVAACTGLMLVCGVSPAAAYQMFFQGIFGNLSGFCEIFIKAAPLILTGLGCAVAFKTGFFNIGAEGQFYMGAVTAAWIALSFPQVPGPARMVLALLLGFAAGGLWALVAAVMKARFGISPGWRCAPF